MKFLYSFNNILLAILNSDSSILKTYATIEHFNYKTKNLEIATQFLIALDFTRKILFSIKII
jgi:hypothetical protein